MEMEVLRTRTYRIMALIIFSAAFSLQSSAQGYQQIDSSLTVEVEEYMLADTANDLITVGLNALGSSIIVKRFTSAGIDTLPELSILPGGRSNDSLKAVYYQGDLYVLGRFEWKGDSTIRYNGVARLNGNNWESIGLDSLNNYLFSNYYHRPNMFEFGGKLIISGTFDSLGSKEADHMVAWDGKDLTPFEAVIVPSAINFISARNDTLIYISDSIRQNCRITTYYNGQEIFTDTVGYISHIRDRYDHLYLSRWSDLLKVSGDGYESLPLSRPSHLHVGSGAMWYTSLSSVNQFINRYSNEVVSTLLRFDTTYVQGIFGIDSVLYFEIYDPQTPPAQHIYRLMKLDLKDFSSIKGRAYLDLDTSCSFSSGDISLANRILSSSDLKYNVATNKDGYYEIIFESADTILLEGFVQPHCSLSCGTQSYAILPFGLSASNSDFIYQIDPSILDNEIKLSGGVVRRGGRGVIDLNITNLSLNSDTTIASLILDGSLTIDTISHPYTKNGNEYSFNVSPPAFLQTEVIRIKYYVDPQDFAVGDTLTFTTNLTRSDDDLSNNTDTLTRLIIGPYDPNHKISYPEGGMEKPVSEVDYTIEFQNIGSASAINVKVIDTVDTRLPLRYIKIKGTSHPESYSLAVKNNVLIWSFNGINLPDSTSDPEGSKGFISYTAKLNGGFSLPGDQIDNKAYIYFDYEEAVITNTATIFIEETNTIQPPPIVDNTLLKLYPNPFSNSIKAENLSVEDDVLEIWDVRGRKLSSYSINAGEEIEIPTADLEAGLYIIKGTYLGTSKIIKQQ